MHSVRHRGGCSPYGPPSRPWWLFGQREWSPWALEELSGARDLSGKAPRPWQFSLWWPQAKALTSATELTRGRGGWADSPYPLPPASPSPNYHAVQPQVKAWGLQGSLWEQWGNTCQTGAGRWLPRRPGQGAQCQPWPRGRAWRSRIQPCPKLPWPTPLLPPMNHFLTQGDLN